VTQEMQNQAESPRTRRRRRAEGAAPADTAGQDEQSGQPHWYVIHTYSGYENKVKKNLEQRVGTLDMADKIFEIVVPTEEEIIDGPFADFQGLIDEINQEKGKVKVLVSFFGRETPVELDFLQIEKLVK